MDADAGVSLRLAAYAVCIEDGLVLLARCLAPEGDSVWSLPGGGVEPGEDPFETIQRELGEETGLVGVVERLLGVDSRVIPPPESWLGTRHQNVGIYYRVRISVASFGRSRTAQPRKRCGHRFPMWRGCVGPPWSRSASPWHRHRPRPVTSSRCRSAV